MMRTAACAIALLCATAAFVPDAAGASRPCQATSDRESERLQATVRVFGRRYDKVFRVRRCRNRGETDLVLRARGYGGVRLRIDADPGPDGTLRLHGGSEQDSIDARGEITSLQVGDAGRIRARGRFTSGLRGTFRVRGDCA
jgi:hypothetical protein